MQRIVIGSSLVVAAILAISSLAPSLQGSPADLNAVPAGPTRQGGGESTCTAAGRPAVDMGRASVSVETGVHASAILKERTAGHPQLAAAMAASRNALSATGWTHQNHVVAIRVRPKAPPDTRSVAQTVRDFFYPRVLAQAISVSDPVNGVMIFDAWDDGDAGTWEGAVYMENYDSGQWAYFDQQILIDVPATPVLQYLSLHGAADREHFRTRGGNNLHPVKFGQRGLTGPTECSCDSQPRPGPRRGKPGGSDMECFVRVGLDRAAAACGGGVVGCRRAGTAYLSCVGDACNGIAAAQTLAEFYRWARDCWSQ